MSLLHFSLWVPCFGVPGGSPEEQRVVLKQFCSPLPVYPWRLCAGRGEKRTFVDSSLLQALEVMKNLCNCRGSKGNRQGMCLWVGESVGQVRISSASPCSGKAKTVGVLSKKQVQLILVVPNRLTAIIQWNTEASLKSYSTACQWWKAADPGDIIDVCAPPHPEDMHTIVRTNQDHKILPGWEANHLPYHFPWEAFAAQFQMQNNTPWSHRESFKLILTYLLKPPESQ